VLDGELIKEGFCLADYGDVKELLKAEISAAEERERKRIIKEIEGMKISTNMPGEDGKIFQMVAEMTQTIIINHLKSE